MKRPDVRHLAPALVLVLLTGLTACGRGLPAGGVPATPTGPNVAPIIVDGGPPTIAIGNINLPFVTVTVCLPGTTTCQAVDHILLDTGSTGLRVIASVLPTGFDLPPVASPVSGTTLWECLPFVDGYSWGSVRSADVKIADGTASNQPIHLIGDSAIPTAPPDCVNNSPTPPLKSENTVDTFGANGVLGLNVFQYDCGAACAPPASPVIAAYYACSPGTSCPNSAATAVPVDGQVQNPVYNFAVDNNGVVIVLPTAGSSGRVTVSGSLILGIGTHANNQLGSAAVLATDPVSGVITTTFNNQILNFSFMDSGSNALYFNDTLAPCATQLGYYCPAQLQPLSASNQLTAGGGSVVNFSVDNLETLSNSNPTFNALPNVAGPNLVLSSFDWGLPFFYGRSVYVGFEHRSAAQTTGPFIAY